MLDIAALPIALALTLWDALPVFLCIAAATAILVRAVLTGQSLHTFWRIREIDGLEGLVFALLFYPILAPVLVVASVALGLGSRRKVNPDLDIPATPLAAARQRIGEVFGSLLVASVVAAVVKISAPSLPDFFPVYIAVALVAGTIAGHRSGVVAVPAIAIAVHLGGIVPAIACIAAGAGRFLVQESRTGDTPKTETA